MYERAILRIGAVSLAIGLIAVVFEALPDRIARLSTFGAPAH